MNHPLTPKHPGFLVWNPDRNLPRYVHGDLDGAKREALRLSREAPGQSFYVMVPVGMAFVSRPEPTFHTMNPLPLGRPDDGDWERMA